MSSPIVDGALEDIHGVLTTTPTPSPSPQGGGEYAEFAAADVLHCQRRLPSRGVASVDSNAAACPRRLRVGYGFGTRRRRGGRTAARCARPRRLKGRSADCSVSSARVRRKASNESAGSGLP